MTEPHFLFFIVCESQDKRKGQNHCLGNILDYTKKKQKQKQKQTKTKKQTKKQNNKKLNFSAKDNTL